MTEVSNVPNEDSAVRKPSINLTDIAQCVEVLKVCTERGAWRPSELSAVGQLYDRLSKFLEEAGVAQQPSTEAENQQG